MPKIEILNQKETSHAKISKTLKTFCKKSTVLYTFVFLSIAALAVVGSNPAKMNQNDEVNNVSSTNTNPVSTKVANSAAPVDEVTESAIVANLAENANLAVAPNTASMSVSMSVLQDSAAAQTGSSSVEKPKILEVASDKREIKKYTPKEEESIDSIANKFGITAQTVKWVNNIKGDKAEAGKELEILPVDGIVYTVKKDDKLEDIAKKYQADLERIVSYNGLEKKTVKEGQRIVLPGGILPEDERPDYSKPSARSRRSGNNSSSSQGIITNNVPSSNYNVKSGNAYAAGNCTWYAYNRRPDIGSFWGNASSWAASARAAGYRVDSTPSVGAIAQWNAYAPGTYGYGHVAIVDGVNSDGTVRITEMNYGGRYGAITSRTVKASSVSNFIH